MELIKWIGLTGTCNIATNIDLSLTPHKSTFAPVKLILGYIMAFMVLAFSVIPCADDASAAQAEAKYELSPNASHDNDQDHEDACSPFCICSCCAGFSVVAKLPAALPTLIAHQPTYSSYISDRLFSIALPIWQPPQLV